MQLSAEPFAVSQEDDQGGLQDTGGLLTILLCVYICKMDVVYYKPLVSTDRMQVCVNQLVC